MQISGLPSTTTFNNNTVIAVENASGGSNVTGKLTGQSLINGVIGVFSPKPGDTFGTSGGTLSCGCYGFVTNTNGTDMVLFVPAMQYTETNMQISTSNIAICNALLRSTSGYREYDIKQYLTGAYLLNKGRGFQFLATKQNGFNISQNTPFTGIVQLALTF